jgi:hypothetical protein
MEIKRLAIAVIATLATSHAAAGILDLSHEPVGGNLAIPAFVSPPFIAALAANQLAAAEAAGGGVLTFEEPLGLSGFTLSRGEVHEFGWLYFPHAFYLPTPVHVLSISDSRFPHILERSDGGNFQLSSFFHVTGTIPTLSIDGYRDGALVYELDLGPLPGSIFYEFDEAINVDRVSFYTDVTWSWIDQIAWRPAIADVPGAVPVPPTVSLLAIGLIGLALQKYGQKQRG